jgi:hypothetical protein
LEGRHSRDFSRRFDRETSSVFEGRLVFGNGKLTPFPVHKNSSLLEITLETKLLLNDILSLKLILSVIYIEHRRLLERVGLGLLERVAGGLQLSVREYA